MGIADNYFLDLLVKVRSWVSWGGSDLNRSQNPQFKMSGNGDKLCCQCDMNSTQSRNRYFCQSCGRVFCGRCVQGYGFSVVAVKDYHESGIMIKSCKFCSEVGMKREGGKKYSEKVHPSTSPPESPEPPYPCHSGEKLGFSVSDESVRSDLYLEARDHEDSPLAVTSRSPSRSDEEDAEDYPKHFFSQSKDYSHSISDIDSSSVSASNEFYSCKSLGSSPLDSPSRISFTSDIARHSHSVQKGREGTTPQEPLDFENNGLIWFPPPPEDEDDEAESKFFEYDDEDDDVGDSGAMFSSSSSLSNIFPAKERQNEGNKEPLKAVIKGHFRALVSQLLQGEGISIEDWLDIVTGISWQAASFVKPDTSRGGSMDPVDYVKVKCIASGSPSESTIVKGVVCTKNIKHKRMTSQYKNPRLLILGGALEYQKVPNQLSSFDTLLQQENDHLKMIIAKIEALRPNVLLVEKSVSSCAQDYLLEKEISLVLNVKRPLLERISRCTGAVITPSVDYLSKTRLGHCELFKLERVSEEHEAMNQFNKKPSKTLMFFEGCPRRLGCTALLRGRSREELQKVKHVVQYAVFAAHHLSLETSFLADEGASLPKTSSKPTLTSESKIADKDVSVSPSSASPSTCQLVGDISVQTEELEHDHIYPSSPGACNDEFSPNLSLESCFNQCQDLNIINEVHESSNAERTDENDVSSEYFSATDTHQSILVSFSSHCVQKGAVCERSRLLRIKFYGCFDKPLGRYLRDDLFDQASCCQYCKEPAEAHVQCYTHQQGNLTINVKRLPSLTLPGERDGKIWMWHRCMRCDQVGGVPPATPRVVMSDAAWGLSFGKFLELSFSNHATANRVATCGHSLQRDCLRYYGFGSMVAFFRYSPIDILSVQLPPSVLEFNSHVQRMWLRKEAAKLLKKMKTLYMEISDVLNCIEQKSESFEHGTLDTNELHNNIMELKDLITKETNDYSGLLQAAIDILELNRLRRSLLIGSHVWDRRLYSLDSLLRKNSVSKELRSDKFSKDGQCGDRKIVSTSSEPNREPSVPSFEVCVPEDSITTSFQRGRDEKIHSDIEASNLSERIDSAWTGTSEGDGDGLQAGKVKTNQTVNTRFKRRLAITARVHSFDSAIRFQERIRKGLPPSSLHLSTLRSFHASGDYRSMVRDPVSSVTRTYSQVLPLEAQKMNLLLSSTPSFISSASQMADGARLLLPQPGHNLVIAVYDNEPTSIISYALSSKEYEDCVGDKSIDYGLWNESESGKEDSAWQSVGSLNLDYIHYGNYGSEDVSSSSISSMFSDSKKSPHLRIAFGDETSNSGGKVKFSVTCYFAKEFDSLRKKCCPSEVDFVRSLSRCCKWSAQGGKSNVYFAKSVDERFIIKQVTKTELDSFEEFAPEYFKYLSGSLSSRSPTCLAKVLGIYQVTVKHLKGGREMKMDLMVMENLFYKRNISRVYDLKGSARSRYNADTTGENKVLLDMNLLESLRTKPIFLGSKAKRSLERAVWNDTSFLASVDVMDYSLLVGVDEESNELVLGIIDFMRQYTWDKHLETWVKASGILGGPKNTSPTIVSPKQYKKRFRKAMTTYFLTVPDQWST